MSTSDFTFFEVLLWRILFNSVCVYACASMHTYDTAHRWRSRMTSLESVLSSQAGFKDQTQVVRFGSKGLYLLSILQPQLIICLALTSNSTQTVSVVQIFQNIHTLFYLRGKISPSLPNLLHLKWLFSRIQGKYYPGIHSSSKGDSPSLLSWLLCPRPQYSFLIFFFFVAGVCNFQ